MICVVVFISFFGFLSFLYYLALYCSQSLSVFSYAFYFIRIGFYLFCLFSFVMELSILLPWSGISWICYKAVTKGFCFFCSSRVNPPFPGLLYFQCIDLLLYFVEIYHQITLCKTLMRENVEAAANVYIVMTPMKVMFCGAIWSEKDFQNLVFSLLNQWPWPWNKNTLCLNTLIGK